MGRQQIDVTTHSRAEPGVVFDLLADGSSWPSWSPIESFELEQTGEPPPEGVGAIRGHRRLHRALRARVGGLCCPGAMKEDDELDANAEAEFARQVDNLVTTGYPRVAGLEQAEFLAHIEPLAARVPELSTFQRTDSEPIPFVIVVKSELAPGDETIQLVKRRDKRGFSVLETDDLERFRPIDRMALPDGLAYLMVDIDAGGDTRNVTPDAALEIINGRQRSPLTVDEGIALLTHYPEAVAKNAGFSLLGSRCGDRRVTALWVSEGSPKLGWCWAGNPHTWLGSASCASRIGAPAPRVEALP